MRGAIPCPIADKLRKLSSPQPLPHMGGGLIDVLRVAVRLNFPRKLITRPWVPHGDQGCDLVH